MGGVRRTNAVFVFELIFWRAREREAVIEYLHICICSRI